MRFSTLLISSSALLLAVSCGGGDAQPEITVSAEAMAEAEAFYTQTCVTCHGTLGKGDGPAAVALDPKPADFTSAEWHSSVSDEHIAKIIVGGGSAVGKAPTMPPNPVLKSKDEVVLGLVKHIRSLNGK